MGIVFFLSEFRDYDARRRCCIVVAGDEAYQQQQQQQQRRRQRRHRAAAPATQPVSNVSRLVALHLIYCIFVFIRDEAR